MLSYHNITELEGKVASSILDMYRIDYRNLNLASIIASFHRAYGLRDEGNSLSLELINTIRDYSEDIKERNLLVWNLYVIAREFIDEGSGEDALKLIDRAERNWSRDLILGDSMGVYHISWIEQLWLLRAEAMLILDDEEGFQKISDRILLSRFEFFREAEDKTGETILQDRCTYSCMELMAFAERRRDLKKALGIIKQAVIHKAGGKINNDLLKLAVKDECKDVDSRTFNLYLKYYYKFPDSPFDNISYGYCSSCKYFDGVLKCSKREIEAGIYKACTLYEI